MEGSGEAVVVVVDLLISFCEKSHPIWLIKQSFRKSAGDNLVSVVVVISVDKVVDCFGLLSGVVCITSKVGSVVVCVVVVVEVTGTVVVFCVVVVVSVVVDVAVDADTVVKTLDFSEAWVVLSVVVSAVTMTMLEVSVVCRSFPVSN